MKQLRTLTTVLAAVLLLASLAIAPALADDGVNNNKSMSKNIKVPDFGQGGKINEQTSEAEHAFTDFMKFYVPAQEASGAPASEGTADEGFVVYNNVDEVFVEKLPVAKPLINVFVYGPQFEVHGTAFAHRWFDTYAAVSLDDGVTFKKTNLSDSAIESSFNIEEDHNPGGHDPLPHDHNILFGSKNNGAFHAKGYDTPYTAHCSECHGSALQGTAQTPSCYSCHGSNKWEEPTPIELGPIITSVIFKNNKLKGVGENAASKIEVTIVNGETGDELTTTDATLTGTFEFNINPTVQPPCTVTALYDNSPLDDMQGPALAVLDKDGIPLEECEGHPVDLADYPGGAYNVFHAVDGNKVLVAWPSRYCQKGQPAYSIAYDGDDDDLDDIQLARRGAILDLIQNGNADLGITGLSDFGIENDLYLVDAFGVAGNQGSSNMADEGYPQAGVIPFGCVWTARGILLPGDDPRTTETEESHMVWTKAERLTSGRRDPNRIEVRSVQDAGFVITWQEDPDGLRPGQGLGPGEGWSGAVAHSRTDAWYSFINWEYFDIVEDPMVPDDDPPVPINILDANLDKDTGGSGRPKVFVPMAMPMRLSNNAKCNPLDKDTSGTGIPAIYCVYETIDDVPGASEYGLQDQCADTVEIQTGNINDPDSLSTTEICVADTNGDLVADLPNRANTALTRPRTSLQGYTNGAGDKSAWVIVAAEESKGLGKYFFEPDGLLSAGDFYADPCEEDSSLTCTEEIGKNQWYFSFDMGTPDTSAGFGNPNSLVNNLVNQGDMLNQAEVYWETGELVGLMSTADMDDYDPYNFNIVNTEIARRASLLVQGVGKAEASTNKLVAMPSWKQGTMRQGGPADTMLRRFVLPSGFDAAEDNPYAFENMVCGEWLIDAGDNPYYPGGVCADPATNLSGVVPDTCLDDGDKSSTNCPTVDFSIGAFGAGDTNPILQGYIQHEGNQTRVLTWHQCPSVHAIVAGDIDPVACGDPDWDGNVNADNLDDQSWYNPLDISKGHRGFIDGDFVMFLYAWSPNWRLNAKGSDRYDLYVRRSFDGGSTWTTTPTTFTASDGDNYPGGGTVTCESYRDEDKTPGVPDEPKVCYDFAAGDAEHARNVTQHKSMRITTLDPRYAISGSTRGVSITVDCMLGLPPVDADGVLSNWSCDDTSLVQDTDLRNPSRYFMVFETGDNTTVDIGEAEPLDLFYARAESFGDDYVVWTETDTTGANPEECYPSDPHDVDLSGDIRVDSGFCNEFDRMNTGGDSHSSEASLASNSDGSKMYGVSAQWKFEVKGDYESKILESNAMARRVWWLDDYISTENSYTLPGTSSGNP